MGNIAPKNTPILSQLFFMWTKDVYRTSSQGSSDASNKRIPIELPLDFSVSTWGPKFEKVWVQVLNESRRKTQESQKSMGKCGSFNSDISSVNKWSSLTDHRILIKAIWRTYRKGFLQMGLILIMKQICWILRPLIISSFVGELTVFDDVTYYWFIMKCLLKTSALFLFLVIFGLVDKFISIQFSVTEMCLRAGLGHFVMKKCLKLSPTGRKEYTSTDLSGISTDAVTEFCREIGWLLLIVSCTFNLVINFAMMIYFTGISALPGIFTVLITMVVFYVVQERKEILYIERTDARDRKLSKVLEILQGIKVIKLFGWELVYGKRVVEAVKDEMSILAKIFISNVIYPIGEILVPMIVIIVTILSLVLREETIEASALSAIVVLVLDMRYLLEEVPGFSGSYATVKDRVKRIEPLLLSPEIKSTRTDGHFRCNCIKSSSKIPKEYALKRNAVEVCNGHFVWVKDDSSGFLLKEVNIQILEGSLVAIVGCVGAGKSALLLSFLGETEKVSGSLSVHGKLAFVPQEAWVVNNTIRDNILFGNCFNQEAYFKVLGACDLMTDIRYFPQGDATEIGERGLCLSGGQKQRITLARAIYHDADILLLDDPLSAVDSKVGKRIFDNVIANTGMLACKTRIMITNNTTLLDFFDQVIWIQKDSYSNQSIATQRKQKVVSISLQGNTTNLISDIPILPSIMNEDESTDMTSDKISDENDSADMTNDKISDEDHNTDMANDKISDQDDNAGKTNDKISDENDSADMTNDKITDEDDNADMTNDIISDEDDSTDIINNKITETSHDFVIHDFTMTNPNENSNDILPSCNYGLESYNLYFKAVGHLQFLLLIILHVIPFLIFARSTVLMSEWTKAITKLYESSTHPSDVCFSEPFQFNTKAIGFCNVVDNPPFKASESLWETSYSFILTYLILCISSAFFLVIYQISFTYFSTRATQRIADSLLWSVLKSPLHFFQITSMGQFSIRFGYDVHEIGQRIPKHVEIFIRQMSNIIVTLLLVFHFCPNMILTFPPVIWFLLHIEKNCGQLIQRLDEMISSAEGRVYSCVYEIAEGVQVVRAFDQQKRFLSLYNTAINECNQMNYNRMAADIWLYLEIHFVASLWVALVALVLLVTGPVSGNVSNVGLVITYALQLGHNLSFMLLAFGHLRVKATSLERIKSFISSPDEVSLSHTKSTVSQEWPCNGEIIFDNLSLKYSNQTDAVLKDICIKVKATEKIGIVGRTGAGKSSLAMSLFRLVEAWSGKIEIDGVDIDKIGLHDLRSRIAVIPQDSVLFTGTVRSNLDPENLFSDQDIWSALRNVQMDTMVSTLKEGLMSECDEGGSNFSVGQKQLLCLARAMLKRSKLLVLDESTASVDLETDCLIQDIIRSKFTHCTVLSVAHRLSTILDYDRILLMDKGKVIGFDTPERLKATCPLFQEMLKHSL